jgi:hypothetical protein
VNFLARKECLGLSNNSENLADGPGDVSSRFNRRQIEYDRPALAVWHKPLDTKPHGGRVAILRSRDNGVYDRVPVVFENLFSEQRGFMARTFMVAIRTHLFERPASSSLNLFWACFVGISQGEHSGQERSKRQLHSNSIYLKLLGPRRLTTAATFIMANVRTLIFPNRETDLFCSSVAMRCPATLGRLKFRPPPRPKA